MRGRWMWLCRRASANNSGNKAVEQLDNKKYKFSSGKSGLSTSKNSICKFRMPLI